MGEISSTHWLIVVGIFALYFLPTLLARGKRNSGAIFALNLLAGWTFVGWIVALVWALTVEAGQPRRSPFSDLRSATSVSSYFSSSNEVAKSEVTFCRHCGARSLADSAFCSSCGRPFAA